MKWNLKYSDLHYYNFYFKAFFVEEDRMWFFLIIFFFVFISVQYLWNLVKF